MSSFCSVCRIGDVQISLRVGWLNVGWGRIGMGCSVLLEEVAPGGFEGLVEAFFADESEPEFVVV